MLKTILKGAVLGIANIIPGVSGGTMAVAMGIYDKIIHAVTHLISEFKQSMKVLLPIAVGILLGFVGGALVIKRLFAVVPFQTNLFFIGLILGGLPFMVNKVKGSKINPQHVLFCVVFFALVVGAASMGEGDAQHAVVIGFDLVAVLKLFVVGVISAATMVIPGVSGSMILMVLGYYKPVFVDQVSLTVMHVKGFDIAGLLSDCKVLVPFGIGMIVGIIVIAKLIELVFAKYPLIAYWAIIGLIAASPIAILMINQFGTLGPIAFVTGALALLAGAGIALKLGGE